MMTGGIGVRMIDMTAEIVDADMTDVMIGGLVPDMIAEMIDMTPDATPNVAVVTDMIPDKRIDVIEMTDMIDAEPTAVIWDVAMTVIVLIAGRVWVTGVDTIAAMSHNKHHSESLLSSVKGRVGIRYLSAVVLHWVARRLSVFGSITTIT
jgi:hypothetical protein